MRLADQEFLVARGDPFPDIYYYYYCAMLSAAMSNRPEMPRNWETLTWLAYSQAQSCSEMALPLFFNRSTVFAGP